MPDILVTVKAASSSDKAAPTSRMRISQEQYDEALAAAEEAGRPCKYTIEEDQDCEGMSLADAKKAKLEAA